MACTSINIQMTPIYAFKTNKELTPNALKGYARLLDMSTLNRVGGDYRQRLIFEVRSSTAQGVQTIIDHLAKTCPQARGLSLNDFIDFSLLKEIEESGFVKRLYGK